MKTSKRYGGGSHADYDPRVLDNLWPSVGHVLDATALDVIARNAAEGDRAGSMPDESLDALRRSGYFGFPVPTEFDGGGGTIAECCALQRAIGRLDPGLAIAVNMHLFSVGVVVEHWRRERDASWALLEAIATQQRIVASGFAEPGLGGSVLRSNFKVERDVDGYIVSGVKSPCSLARRADLICFQVQEAPKGPEALLICLLPLNAPGISTEISWDALGMRSSESDTVRFEHCHVPEELVFHRCEPGFDADEVFAAGLDWFCVTTVATYLGVAASALEVASATLRQSPLQYQGAMRADLVTFQAAVGDSISRLATLEMACLHLASLLDSGKHDPRSLLPLGLALKDRMTDTVTGVVGDLVETVGAQAYGRAGRLSRLWRDSQAARFHPPTRFATRQILGRWSLGLPFTFEVADRPAQPGP
jgi:alkylation response protein AidB-like acyl-CoA dehydrogenase